MSVDTASLLMAMIDAQIEADDAGDPEAAQEERTELMEMATGAGGDGASESSEYVNENNGGGYNLGTHFQFTHTLATAHAPPGGIRIQGKYYKGGRFIPNKVLEEATPQEKEAISDGEGDEFTEESAARRVMRAIYPVAVSLNEQSGEKAVAAIVTAATWYVRKAFAGSGSDGAEAEKAFRRLEEWATEKATDDEDAGGSQEADPHEWVCRLLRAGGKAIDVNPVLPDEKAVQQLFTEFQGESEDVSKESGEQNSDDDLSANSDPEAIELAYREAVKEAEAGDEDAAEEAEYLLKLLNGKKPGNGNSDKGIDTDTKPPVSDPQTVLMAYLEALEEAESGDEAAAEEADYLRDLLDDYPSRDSRRTLSTAVPEIVWTFWLSWEPYGRSRTGKNRWKDSDTGRIRYQERKPGEKREKREEESGKARAVVMKVMNQEDLSDDDIKTFAATAEHMTVKQLREARQLMAARFGGSRIKQGMVDALRQHVREIMGVWREREKEADEAMRPREEKKGVESAAAKTEQQTPSLPSRKPGERALPPVATKHLPGSPEKAQVMAARLAAGYHLHHPDDAKPNDPPPPANEPVGLPKAAQEPASSGQREEKKERGSKGKKSASAPSDSVYAAVLKFGGIRPSDDFNTREDFQQAGLFGLFRKNGKPLDEIAEELAAAGIIKIPENRHADDYLVEVLQSRGKSLLANRESEYAAAEEKHYRSLENAKRAKESESGIAGSVRDGETEGSASSGDSFFEDDAGYAGEGEASDSQASGGNSSEPDDRGYASGTDFDFGANAVGDSSEEAPSPTSPASTAADTTSPAAHLSPIHGIKPGASSWVGGHMVRRNQDGTYRLETDKHHVTGSADEIAARIARNWADQKPERTAAEAALARADARGTIDPFTNPEAAKAEEKRRAAIKDGARVVSLDENTRGRLGTVSRDEDGKLTVKVDGSPDVTVSDFEPLVDVKEESGSEVALPAEPESKQGNLLEGLPEPPPTPVDPNSALRDTVLAAHRGELLTPKQKEMLGGDGKGTAGWTWRDPNTGEELTATGEQSKEKKAGDKAEIYLKADGSKIALNENDLRRLEFTGTKKPRAKPGEGLQSRIKKFEEWREQNKAAKAISPAWGPLVEVAGNPDSFTEAVKSADHLALHDSINDMVREDVPGVRDALDKAGGKLAEKYAAVAEVIAKESGADKTTTAAAADSVKEEKGVEQSAPATDAAAPIPVHETPATSTASPPSPYASERAALVAKRESLSKQAPNEWVLDEIDSINRQIANIDAGKPPVAEETADEKADYLKTMKGQYSKKASNYPGLTEEQRSEFIKRFEGVTDRSQLGKIDREMMLAGMDGEKKGVGKESKEAKEPKAGKQEEPGFTGIDAIGRRWENGELVAAKEEPNTEGAASGQVEEIAGPGRGQSAPDVDAGTGGRRADVGGIDGGSNSIPGATGGRKPRIVTAREHLVKHADPGLVHESVRKHLNETQVQGAAKAIESLGKHGGFLLADGTGTGKTRQELAVAATRAAQGKKVLIVSPSEVLKPDWKKGAVAGSFANDSAAMGMELHLTRGDVPMLPGNVYLTTYDQLSKMKGHIGSDTTIIFDESHSLKNWGSARSKHGYEMSKKAGEVMYATATPADKPLHIAHLFRAKVFGDKKWEQTYQELGMRQVEVRIGGGQTITQWQVDPRVGYPEVYRRMSGLFDRMIEDGLMMKREISLDGLQVNADRITLPDDVKKELDQVYSQAMKDTDGNKAVALMEVRRAQEQHKIPHTVNAVQEELKAGRSVVVFASLVNDKEAEDNGSGDGDSESGSGSKIDRYGTMKQLREALEKAGISGKEIAELHGGATKTAAQKAKAMEAFQSGKARVILATVESGGTGVNLDDTKGDKPRTTIVMTPPFSAVSNVQLAGRTWRLNTQSDSKIRHIFADTVIDDWNAALIAKKMKVHGAVVGGEAMKLDVPKEESDAASEVEIGGNQENPFKWRPLVRTAESGSSSPSSTASPASSSGKPISISGDTFQHKDAIKEAGGRWDGANKQWTIDPAKAERLRKLTGLKFSDQSESAKPESTSVPSVSPSVPDDGPYISDSQRKAIHEALQMLAGNDPDRARDRNNIGFNQMDSEFGSKLAASYHLTDRQAAAGAKLLAKYHRQIPAELLSKATTFEKRPEGQAAAQKQPEAVPVNKDKYTVSGNTYAHKDAIKSAGGRWDSARGVWVIPAASKAKLEKLTGLRFS